MTHGELAALVVRFVETFNRDDLDGMMAFFADDAVYDEFNGTRSHGKAAIRAAFEPQFRGDFGAVRFHTEDVFVDAVAGKALVRWRCTLQGSAIAGQWHGLDVLRFEGGLLKEKLTYAKASVPLLQAVA